MDIYGNLDEEDLGWGKKPTSSDIFALIIYAALFMTILGIIDSFINP